MDYKIKSLKWVVLLATLLCIATSMLLMNTAYASSEESEVYYDTILKTSSLGNYEITVRAYERPSHEVLPIIQSGYFPTSDEKYKTEVDNTRPSAVYKANVVSKVDVVFALGELSQIKQLENYIPNFEQQLRNPSNAFDVLVTSVETVTGGFDMAEADVNTIYNFWDQHPNPNNFTLHGSYLLNAVFDWNGRPSTIRSATRHNHMFIASDTYDIIDFELSSTYAWHGCSVGSGYVFRYNKELDSAYVITCGPTVQLRKVTGIAQYIGHNGGNGPFLDYNNIGELLGSYGKRYVVQGDGEDLTLVMKGNRIIVKCGEQILIDYTDSNPIKSGGAGLWAGCTASFSDVSLSYETTVRKSLGESISDVSWRDGSTRFIVHATDVIPEECLPGNEGDFAHTVSKISNSNAYLINIGNNINKGYLEKLMRSIVFSDGTTRGFYYDNNPISTGLDKSANKIISIAKDLRKPTDWVLVDTELLWNTEYKDGERDVPLNFGEHNGTKKQPQDKSDITLATSWNIPLTNLYSSDKSLAEKWRYKHQPTFFDNSHIQAGFNEIWIVNPIETFEQPGKYRVNYKRRDNPIYPNVNLIDTFDTYRYWSTDYDRREN